MPEIRTTQSGAWHLAASVQLASTSSSLGDEGTRRKSRSRSVQPIDTSLTMFQSYVLNDEIKDNGGDFGDACKGKFAWGKTIKLRALPAKANELDIPFNI